MQKCFLFGSGRLTVDPETLFGIITYNAHIGITQFAPVELFFLMPTFTFRAKFAWIKDNWTEPLGEEELLLTVTFLFAMGV